MDFSFVSGEAPLERKQPANSRGSQQAANASASTGTQRPSATGRVGHSGATGSGVPVVPPLQQSVPQHGGGGAAAPSCDPMHAGANPNAIIVSRRQQGNPLLNHIRNVRWQYGDILPDYLMGATTCAIFLSLRFHLLKPEYLHHRIKQLQRAYRLRVVLVHVDIVDTVEALSQVTRAALLNDCTLICAFSVQECARYLETLKAFESKGAANIQGRTEEDYLSRLNGALTAVRGISRTNVLTLGRQFGTAAGIMQASMEELAACPGIGPTKVRRLYETFHEPFRRNIGSEVQDAAASPGVSAPLQPAAAAENMIFVD